MKPPPARDYYEVLGVKKTATPAEIKRNYRQKATRAHPDKKSGNHGEMAELAEAYRVLSDPVLRARYDETGTIDDPEDAIKIKVREMIFAAFNEALSNDAPHVLDFAKKYVAQIKMTVTESQKKVPRLKARMETLREKIKTTDEENLFQMTVDQQLRHVDDVLKQLQFNLEVVTRAEALMANYSSDEEIDLLGMLAERKRVVTFRLGS